MTQTDTPTPDFPLQGPPGGLAVLALVGLGDWLFWDLVPGISLVIFGAAVMAVAGVSRRGWLAYALGALPAVEMVQPLSVGFWLAGMALAVLLTRGAPLSVAGAMLARLPLTWVRALDPRPLGRLPMGGLVRAWAFPLGGGLVLLALLAEANPLIENAFHLPDLAELPQRAVFWLGIVLLVAPFLAPLPPPPRGRALPGMGLNAASVLRALWVFNLILAVQLASDAMALSGGLPPGMSHATYAHRGAYPLLATALLAGAFALAAQPFLRDHTAMRPLLLLWLAQNIALTGTAAWRLAVYVQAWGLSSLRLHAGIWMAVVALGLGLCLWQIAAGRGTGWMLRRTAALGIATLYACGFVNFAGVIAAENLSRPDPDYDYICTLGPMAAPEIAAAMARDPLAAGALGDRYDDWTGRACDAPPRIDHWQEWGFRAWRVARKVGAYEDPPR